MTQTFGEEMKQLPPVLFAIGYFLGGWGVIWILVMLLKRADPKFSEAVGFYYGLWICFYFPIAIMGTIALAKMSGEVNRRLVAASISLVAVLSAMFVSFYWDAHLTVLLIEYLAFAVGFWLLARSKNNDTEQAHGEQRLTRPEFE